MGKMEVTVVEGRNLAAKDVDGTSDPFVKLKVGHREVSTRVIKSTLNPRWNEKFTLNVGDEHKDQLLISVWDKDFIGKESLGSYSLSLGNLNKNVPNDMWLNLQRIKRGELHIVIVPDFGRDTYGQPPPSGYAPTSGYAPPPSAGYGAPPASTGYPPASTGYPPAGAPPPGGYSATPPSGGYGQPPPPPSAGYPPQQPAPVPQQPSGAYSNPFQAQAAWGQVRQTFQQQSTANYWQNQAGAGQPPAQPFGAPPANPGYPPTPQQMANQQPSTGYPPPTGAPPPNPGYPAPPPASNPNPGYPPPPPQSQPAPPAGGPGYPPPPGGSNPPPAGGPGYPPPPGGSQPYPQQQPPPSTGYPAPSNPPPSTGYPAPPPQGGPPPSTGYPAPPPTNPNYQQQPPTY
eukprot:TRINITY_DN67869_c5_g1_i1.p2 TRINITY_DN67869_c5_g1~~TRINITY_DN67869_c5_g1_i1.p2  ORF type:complete len:400 (-),score=85.40 TRINITY_DN67869_c5_g1_i1:1719-2918(-)